MQNDTIINDIDIICVYWKPLMVMTRIYGSIKKIYWVKN